MTFMDKPPQKEQNVVEMTKYQTETGFAPISQIEAYWDALRGTRLMPKRSEIDPRGIEQALEFAFIVERIAPGIARLRIAGSHLSDLMGMEVRGMPLTSFFTPGFRRQLSSALEEVFETPAMCDLQLRSEASASGRGVLDARMILMPLKSDLGDVSRILGCLVSHGDIGPTPRRFDIVHSDLRAITPRAAAPVRPQQPAPSKLDLTPAEAPKRPLKTSGMAEEQTSFTPAKTASGRKLPPYLRLVKSDD